MDYAHQNVSNMSCDFYYVGAVENRAVKFTYPVINIFGNFRRIYVGTYYGHIFIQNQNNHNYLKILPVKSIVIRNYQQNIFNINMDFI